MLVDGLTLMLYQVAQKVSLPGDHLSIKMSSYQYRDPQVKDRLIFNIGIPIHGEDSLYIETGPRQSSTTALNCYSTSPNTHKKMEKITWSFKS